MDDVCVGAVGQADVRAGRQARLPPVLLVSPTTTPHAGRLTGPGARRAAECAAALAGRRHSTAHEDDAAAVLRTVPRCN